MADITITHTRAEGTLLDGSRKGDGVWDVLKGLHDNWRYFRSIGQIGIGQSRDRAAHRWKIERAAEALRAAGHTVTVDVDDLTPGRSTADREADAYERAEARADYHAEQAGKRSAEAARRFAAEHQILDGIPMGQPILVGHHSERRHRRDLERAEGHLRAGIAATRQAEHHQDRAATAATYKASRESIPTTLRRIEKLEAEARDIARRLDGRMRYVDDGNGGQVLRLVKPQGEYLARLEMLAAETADQLAYWREHVKRAEADGVKVWGPADFTKGDFMRFMGTTWYEVLRVNAKSVTIPAMISDGAIVTKANSRMSWTDTIPYHKVTGRKSAADMAALLAEVERRESA